ncbi:hypothetical protein FRB98_004939 [Tulasnella sp. 332]|nr:hypothetical protein FRB98_004939 [Tulasnella sp. 332]
MTVALDLIAGSIAGAAQILVGQPLDTVKTRAQIAPKGMFKGPMDILMQTIRNEGFFALYKGMAAPLLGIAGVNSLLFASYATAKRIVTPFPDLSIGQTAVAGAMAGAANAILASPGQNKKGTLRLVRVHLTNPSTDTIVEMFKVRMQGQYGAKDDQRLRAVFSEVAKDGFRRGIMRGYWVTVVREIPAYAGFYAAFEFTKRRFQRTLLAIMLSISIPAAGATFAAFELSRDFLEKETSL